MGPDGGGDGGGGEGDGGGGDGSWPHGFSQAEHIVQAIWYLDAAVMGLLAINIGRNGMRMARINRGSLWAVSIFGKVESYGSLVVRTMNRLNWAQRSLKSRSKNKVQRKVITEKRKCRVVEAAKLSPVRERSE